jgi:hypothetical protein
MNASSTEILTVGINAVTRLFIDLLQFAVVNWIPIIIAVVVVVGVIGFLFSKAKGLFHGSK